MYLDLLEVERVGEGTYIIQDPGKRHHCPIVQDIDAYFDEPSGKRLSPAMKQQTRSPFSMFSLK